MTYKVKASNFLRTRTIRFKTKREAKSYAEGLRQSGFFEGIKITKIK